MSSRQRQKEQRAALDRHAARLASQVDGPLSLYHRSDLLALVRLLAFYYLLPFLTADLETDKADFLKAMKAPKRPCPVYEGAHAK